MARPASIGDFVDGVGNVVGGVVDGVGNVVSGISEGIAFASDPLGYVFEKLQQSAQGWYEVIIPALVKAAKPDLTLEWFLGAYSVSFGVAIFGWVTLLLVQTAMAGRPGRSRFDLIDSLTEKSGLFLVGAAYGPALGWVVVHFFHTLSEFFLSRWGTSVDDALESLKALISDSNWASLPGGLVIGIGLMAAMLIAAVLVVIMLVLALVAIYMTGVVFPLAWMWLVGDPSKRTISARFAWMWFGLNAAHPLMFFLLGTAFQMISSSIGLLDEPQLATIVNAIAAFIAMVMCALAPALLFKFAPVLPTSAGQQMPASGGGGRHDTNSTPSGSPNTEDAGNRNAGGGDEGSGGGGAGTGAGSGSQDEEPGPLEQAAADDNDDDQDEAETSEDSTESSAGEGAEDDGVETEADQDDPAGEESVGDGAGAPDSTADLGDEPGGDPQDADPAGADSTEGAGQGAEAAGGGEAAAGAGAGAGAGAAAGPIGLGLMAAKAAADKARDGLENAAQMAAADADDNGGPR